MENISKQEQSIIKNWIGQKKTVMKLIMESKIRNGKNSAKNVEI